MAEHIAGVEGIGDHHGAAVDAGGAQVVKSLQVAALALPVADREVDELELRDVAEVGDGKDRGERRTAGRCPRARGQLVHLQKALVAAALHFDQVRDLNGGGDFRKIEAAAKGAGFTGHASLLKGSITGGAANRWPSLAAVRSIWVACALDGAAGRLCCR